MRSLALVILIALAFSVTGVAQESNATEELVGDIEEYQGSIGPGNALYGLKLAFEKLDLAFTFNESEKLGKQVSYARLRIAEAKVELRKNNTEAANRAIAKYEEDAGEVTNLVAKLSDKERGLLNAQKMIVKHQFVLRELLNQTPNNTGLQRAYNNSLELEKKFEEKTRIKLERRLAKRGIILGEVKKEEIEEKEKMEVKAKIIENATQVNVEIKFVTNKTENSSIADEILNRIEFASENISSLIKIEAEEKEEKEKLKEELKAEAEVEENVSKVEFDYSFYLNVTNETEIISGVQQKLSLLNQTAIIDVLEMKVKELKIEEKAEKMAEKQEERSKSQKGRNGRGPED